MKFKKILFVLINFFAAFQIDFAQEKPKANLIYELNSIGGCEHYWSSLDILFTELSNEIDSVGYVVVSGNKDNVIQTIIYKEWADNHFRFRKLTDARLKTINKNRIFVVSGEDSTELKIQLYKVPNNDEKSFKFNTDFNYLLELKKPLILFDSDFDGGGLCPTIDYRKVFSDFLKYNPDLNGNVVFYENSKSKFLERKKDFLKEIKEVSQNRFRFFRSPNTYDGYQGLYEFWLVPQKKK